MDLILLPGNSKNNEKWIEEIAQILSEYFDSCEILKYRHWKTGGELLNFETELDKLREFIKKSKNYALFAKSAGVILALKAIKSGAKPKKCVFLGAPILWAKEAGIEVESLFSNNISTLFIQQTGDPVISFLELKRFLECSSMKNYKIVEVRGDDHHYAEIRKIREIVLKFLK